MKKNSIITGNNADDKYSLAVVLAGENNIVLMSSVLENMTLEEKLERVYDECKSVIITNVTDVESYFNLSKELEPSLILITDSKPCELVNVSTKARFNIINLI